MELTKLCRLCLSKWDLQCSMFMDLDESDGLYESILKCADIEIKNHYGWPHLICKSCLNTVKAINSFRDMIRRSDARLKQYIKMFEPALYPTYLKEDNCFPQSSAFVLSEKEFNKMLSFAREYLEESVYVDDLSNDAEEKSTRLVIKPCDPKIVKPESKDRFPSCDSFMFTTLDELIQNANSLDSQKESEPNLETVSDRKRKLSMGGVDDSSKKKKNFNFLMTKETVNFLERRNVPVILNPP